VPRERNFYTNPPQKQAQVNTCSLQKDKKNWIRKISWSQDVYLTIKGCRSNVHWSPVFIHAFSSEKSIPAYSDCLVSQEKWHPKFRLWRAQCEPVPVSKFDFSNPVESATCPCWQYSVLVVPCWSKKKRIVRVLLVMLQHGSFFMYAVCKPISPLNILCETVRQTFVYSNAQQIITKPEKLLKHAWCGLQHWNAFCLIYNCILSVQANILCYEI